MIKCIVPGPECKIPPKEIKCSCTQQKLSGFLHLRLGSILLPFVFSCQRLFSIVSLLLLFPLGSSAFPQQYVVLVGVRLQLVIRVFLTSGNRTAVLIKEEHSENIIDICCTQWSFQGSFKCLRM